MESPKYQLMLAQESNRTKQTQKNGIPLLYLKEAELFYERFWSNRPRIDPPPYYALDIPKPSWVDELRKKQDEEQDTRAREDLILKGFDGK
jgi:hypothetical protein